jgi:GNAT superfamily N-acetyltransferase
VLAACHASEPAIPPVGSAAEFRAAVAAGRLFVAVRKGEVLGLLDAVSGRLARVFVRPEWAAQGLGRWLALVALGMGVGASDAPRAADPRPPQQAASR